LCRSRATFTPIILLLGAMHYSALWGLSSSIRGSSTSGHIRTDRLLVAAAGALVSHAKLLAERLYNAQLLAATGDQTASRRYVCEKIQRFFTGSPVLIVCVTK
jgi:hypothetical protein